MIFVFMLVRFSYFSLNKNHAKLLTFLTSIDMKKTVLIITMLIIIVSGLSAQKSKDVFYLKNGTRVFGKLLEISDNQYKILTAEGNVIAIQGTEIEKYVNESAINDTLKKNNRIFALEAGVLAGAQSSKYDAAFSFNIMATLVQNRYNKLSLGSGVEFLGQTYVPVFLEYKLNASEKKTTPFLFIRGGKLFHLNGDFERTDQISQVYNTPMSYKGAFSFTLGLGISWIREDLESYLSFAYRNAHISYNEEDNSSLIYTYKTAYNRLEIKYGLRF